MARAAILWALLAADGTWFVDLCAGGATSDDERQALTFPTIEAAERALDAADIDRDGVAVVPAPRAAE